MIDTVLGPICGFMSVYLQTGRIFATTSVILRSAGSVGTVLAMWLLGAMVAATGSAVYLEYGTVSAPSLPRMLEH